MPNWSRPTPRRLTGGPVCEQNFQLPKTQINFQGMLQGNWDGSGSVSGSWTGPDLSCGGRWTFQGSNTYAPKCP